METNRKRGDKGHIEYAEQMCGTYTNSTLIKKFIAQGDVHLARIDKTLLVFKLFYFLFYGSLGTTFPFLPTYFAQIGFSSYQIQLLAWVRSLVQLLTSPLWGIAADRWLPKKRMLQFCTFVWLIGTISLAFVEPTGQICQLVSLNDTESKVINATEMRTGFFRRRRSNGFFTMQSKLIPRNHKDNLSNNGFESLEVPIGSGSGNTQATENDSSGSGLAIESLYPHKEHNITSRTKTHDPIKFTSPHHKSNFKDTPNFIELNFTIRNELRENRSRLYRIFLGALALVVFEEIFLCPILFVTDAVLLTKQTEDNTILFGRQRVFGSVGFMVCFLITGSLVNNSQRPVCGHIYADYIINFCFFCIITIATLLILIKFEAPYRAPENSPCERLKAIYYNKHYGSFFAAAIFMGFSHTVVTGFHTTLLSGVNVGHSTATTINTFRLLGEPFAFFMSHKLVNHVGIINMLFATLVLYMFNHFACSFVTSPWHVIPLGFFEGFIFANSFVVCVTYLASSSPSDHITTIQGKT